MITVMIYKEMTIITLLEMTWYNSNCSLHTEGSNQGSAKNSTMA